MVWTAGAPLATLGEVTDIGSPNLQPRDSQGVRSSFEATGLREAAEAAGQLRRDAPHGVRVLPAQLSQLTSPMRVLIIDDSAPKEDLGRVDLSTFWA